jgi:FkbM family methyltransferase
VLGPRSAAGRWAQRIAHSVGYDIQYYVREGPELGRRGKLLESRGITVVLDVGAAKGVYAAQLRLAGYRGRIVSFEPLSKPFRKLEKAAADDPGWECIQTALGTEEGTTAINVAGNSDSSSFLQIGDRHLEAAPQSAYVKEETVEVRRLDSIWDRVVRPDDRPYLKLDVQGFELEVLRGAEGSLPQVAAVQAELSLVPVYEGGPVFREVFDYLEEHGFRLVGLEPGFEDHETGELLQADGTFVRD